MAASLQSYRFSGMGPLARFYPARHIGLKALAVPVDKNRTGNATNRNTSNDMSSEWISFRPCVLPSRSVFDWSELVPRVASSVKIVLSSYLLTSGRTEPALFGAGGTGFLR